MSKPRSIIRISDSEEVEYPSARAAAAAIMKTTNAEIGLIYKCCRYSKPKRAYGYEWRFKNQKETIPEEDEKGEEIYFFGFPSLQDKLKEYIVAIYNEAHKRVQINTDQVRRLMPLYLHFVSLLI